MAKEILEMEVKSNIKSVTKETDALGESIGKASDETKGLDKGLEETGKSGSKGFKAIGTAVKGFGMALKAAGIGLVVALFVTLKEALERNQKVMNAVNTIMTTVSTTFNQVADVLTDVVGWVTKSEDRFDGLTKVISGLMTIALTPLKAAFYAIKLAVQGAMLAWEDSFLGGGDVDKIAKLRISIAETSEDIKEVGLAAIDAGKDIGANIGDAIGEIGAIGKMAIDGISEISIKSNIELAKATTAAANSSKLAEAQIQGLIEKYDRQAELQRHIRDSEKATFEERIAANKEIDVILKKQQAEMLALADIRVASAKLEKDANEDNIDLEVAYQQTLNDRAGVLAQIAGFQSEQKTNQESLEKELGETRKELNLAVLEGITLELQELQNSYEMQLLMADKAGMATTEITAKYAKDKAKIIKDNAEEEEKIAKDNLEKTEQINDAKLASQVALTSSIGGSIKALGGLFNEGTEASKAAALAEIAINTGIGFVQGLDIAQKSASATGPAAAVAFPIFYATQVAAVLAAAAQAKTILGAGAGGGGGGGVGGGGSVPPAPQMMQGAFELEGGLAPEPVKAFVVTDEMTNSQNQLANIRRRATI
jgi:hypothetical protein